MEATPQIAFQLCQSGCDTGSCTANVGNSVQFPMYDGDDYVCYPWTGNMAGFTGDFHSARGAVNGNVSICPCCAIQVSVAYLF